MLGAGSGNGDIDKTARADNTYIAAKKYLRNMILGVDTDHCSAGRMGCYVRRVDHDFEKKTLVKGTVSRRWSHEEYDSEAWKKPYDPSGDLSKFRIVHAHGSPCFVNVESEIKLYGADPESLKKHLLAIAKAQKRVKALLEKNYEGMEEDYDIFTRKADAGGKQSTCWRKHVDEDFGIKEDHYIVKADIMTGFYRKARKIRAATYKWTEAWSGLSTGTCRFMVVTHKKVGISYLPNMLERQSDAILLAIGESE
jgi:hypothetical protein